VNYGIAQENISKTSQFLFLFNGKKKGQKKTALITEQETMK
jgi:hypothetical protein